jgi:acyl CoA:acetate/3-ketoacid CoA transferase
VKSVQGAAAAGADIGDGAVVMIGGFGVIQGGPATLIRALRDRGSRGLTIICNTPGVGPTSPQQLAENGQIAKLIASYAAYPSQPTPIEAGIKAGAIDFELRLLVVMFHLTRDGTPKLVRRCTYPLTAIGCVATVVTDLAVIDAGADGFTLRETAPGVTADEVRQVTGAPLRIAPDVREMEF